MINKLLDKIFPKRLLFITLSPNSVVIKDIESGNVISKKALKAFSNERLIIADFNIAEQFLREVLSELHSDKGNFFKQSVKVVLQIKDKEKPTITPVERRIYQDVIEHIGAAYFWLIEHQNPVQDNEVIQIAKN